MGIALNTRWNSSSLGGTKIMAGQAIRQDGRISEGTGIDINQLLQRLSVPLCWLLLIVFFGVLKPDAFLAARTLSSILGSAAPVVVLTIATVITLRGGDYDLSGAAVMLLASNIVGVLNIREHVDIGPAIAIAIAMAVMIGFVNAFFCIVVGVDSFIATLGMSTILAGLTLWISDSNSYSGLSDWLVNVVTNRDLLDVPFSFYIALLITIVVWLVFEYTPLGRRHLFVGKSREISKLNGIAVDRTRTVSFLCCSVLSAVAGILYAGAAGGIDPTSALTLLLPAFAAAFLGSTTILPGQFNPWGAFVSVYFIVTGITGLAILGLPTFVQSFFYGGALVVAVSLAQLVRSSGSRSSRRAAQATKRTLGKEQPERSGRSSA
jgi:ribose transport system permease protein